MSKPNESVAKHIIVEYEDGTAKELDKGLVFRFEDEDEDTDTAHITAELVGMTGRDLYTVVSAAVELGIKIGMFNDTDAADADEA